MTKNRIIIVILAVIYILSFTACSDNNNQKNEIEASQIPISVEADNTQKEKKDEHNLLVREKKTYYTSGDLLFYDYVYSYDSNENQIKSARYDKNGKLQAYYKYYFNDKNLQTSGASFGADDAISSTWDIEYNSDGLVTKRIDYDSAGQITSRYEHEYDTRGNEIKKISYNEKGEITSKDIFTYDENNRKSTGEYYLDAFGTDRYEYEYDSLGNMIQSKSYDVNERLKKTVKFQYDGNNNQISGTSYDKNDNIISMWEAEYDEHNKIIKEVEKDKDGKISSTTIYERKYDDADNCLYELCTVDGDKSYLYEYEYVSSNIYMLNGYVPVFESINDNNEKNGAENNEFFLENVKKGKEVKFGKYRQSVWDTEKTDLEWIVLDVKQDKALIITKYIIDAVSYNETNTDIDWENCSIRKWLNSEFIEETFSPTEESAILLTHITNDDNARWGTEAGNDTDDYVFFLSIKEAEKYFPTEEKSRTLPTKYAEYQGVDTSLSVHNGKIIEGYGNWWLRSPGVSADNVSYIFRVGGVNDFGYFPMGKEDIYIKKSIIGMRPAMWVKIK